MKFEIEGTSDTKQIKLIITEDGGFEVICEEYYLISVDSNGIVKVNENPRFGLKYAGSIK